MPRVESVSSSGRSTTSTSIRVSVQSGPGGRSCAKVTVEMPSANTNTHEIAARNPSWASFDPIV
jgi:hypothetical protein